MLTSETSTLLWVYGESSLCLCLIDISYQVHILNHFEIEIVSMYVKGNHHLYTSMQSNFNKHPSYVWPFVLYINVMNTMQEHALPKKKTEKSLLKPISIIILIIIMMPMYIIYMKLKHVYIILCIANESKDIFIAQKYSILFCNVHISMIQTQEESNPNEKQFPSKQTFQCLSRKSITFIICFIPMLYIIAF